jgi:hypothetical protein
LWHPIKWDILFMVSNIGSGRISSVISLYFVVNTLG